ncbi:hypothetical protein P691DRAFT_772632 [Macrolepiota fuliginosa MF-IS2]|uniref:Uncharacterized protein n=1 Tax=Macrolepiota fuliginosa MF-IS2 TaxID=1400762 RepID=A0A9P6C4P0_9AGAR|nr:hypothetical protein P691DRAFT_772632 [Macrolepiota fuliginosa MF-IS2]
MVSPSSSAFLYEHSAARVPNTPTQFPITPPRKHKTPPQIASSLSTAYGVSSQGVRPVGRRRALSYSTESNGEQGRITMQTRVAVRDTTPHRFQIIPLREAKHHHDLDSNSEVHPKRSKDFKQPPPNSPYQINEPSSLPTLQKKAHPQEHSASLSGSGDKLSLTFSSSSTPTKVSRDDLCLQESGSQHEQDADKPMFLESVSMKALHCSYHPATLLPESSDRQLNVGYASHTTITDSKFPSELLIFRADGYPGSQRAHKRATNSENISQAQLNDCHTYNVGTGKPQVRAYSEDLARYRGKASQNRVHDRLCPSWSRDDSSWYSTKRHAIYADALVLPLFERDSGFCRNYPKRSLLSSSPRNPLTDQTSCQRCAKPQYSGDVFNRLADGKAARASSRIVSSSRSEAAIFPKKFSGQPRPPTDYFSPSPVPHLCLARKSRDPSTVRARVISTLSVVHERPVNYSKIILDLLAQLDHAIEEWDNLGRDHTEARIRIQTAADPRF